MAKGNIFLGKASGRVGSVVFSKGRKGQQVTRAYQSQVANPKTLAQMVQRGIFASVSTAGSVLGDIVSHSFDGIKEGQDNRNEFVRVNVNKMSAMVRADGAESINANIKPKGASYMQPFEFQLSRGSLGDYYFGSRVLGTFSAADGGVTIGNLMSLFPNLQAGSQLTFIGLYEDFSTQPRRSYRIMKCRLVFNELAFADLNTQVLVNNNFIATYFDIPKCDGFVYQQSDNYLEGRIFGALGAGGSDVQVVFYDPEESAYVRINGALVGWAVILTNYNEAKADPWLHSTSTMAIDYDAWDDTNDNIATYGASSEEKSSDLYLDQALPERRGAVDENVNTLVSGIVYASDRAPEAIAVGQRSDYGPVAEGTLVSISISVPGLFKIHGMSATINGSPQWPEGWAVTMSPASRTMTFSGPMGAEPMRIKPSVNVWSYSQGKSLGLATFDVNITTGG